MKVLFCALHFGYFRNFESVIAALAERGHDVHLAADEADALGGQALVERLKARFPAGAGEKPARASATGNEKADAHDRAILPSRGSEPRADGRHRAYRSARQ